MKQLEIVEVRVVAGAISELASAIGRSAAGQDANTRVKVYTRQDVGTDVSVHIISDGSMSAARKSATGLRLASELRGHGMVRHTVWAEHQAIRSDGVVNE